jgi:hypothetical protein
MFTGAVCITLAILYAAYTASQIEFLIAIGAAPVWAAFCVFTHRQLSYVESGEYARDLEVWWREVMRNPHIY